MSQALEENGIRYCKTGGAKNKAVSKKFKSDPGIQVILLHGKSEAAGLTL